MEVYIYRKDIDGEEGPRLEQWRALLAESAGEDRPMDVKTPMAVTII